MRLIINKMETEMTVVLEETETLVFRALLEVASNVMESGMVQLAYLQNETTGERIPFTSALISTVMNKIREITN